jgi:hypothetical protein
MFTNKIGHIMQHYGNNLYWLPFATQTNFVNYKLFPIITKNIEKNE